MNDKSVRNDSLFLIRALSVLCLIRSMDDALHMLGIDILLLLFTGECDERRGQSGEDLGHVKKRPFMDSKGQIVLQMERAILRINQGLPQLLQKRHFSTLRDGRVPLQGQSRRNRGHRIAGQTRLFDGLRHDSQRWKNLLEKDRRNSRLAQIN